MWGRRSQAKRRGRGVMLSHMTPVMVPVRPVSVEYSRMAELVKSIDLARAWGAVTTVKKWRSCGLWQVKPEYWNTGPAPAWFQTGTILWHRERIHAGRGSGVCPGPLPGRD
ncbi:MAG: hypothetical protein U5K27_02220 [Desulfotignum sp.]|nr:hypothetical protein [Desulfotignum sp.]